MPSVAWPVCPQPALLLFIVASPALSFRAELSVEAGGPMHIAIPMLLVGIITPVATTSSLPQDLQRLPELGGGSASTESEAGRRWEWMGGSARLQTRNDLPSPSGRCGTMTWTSPSISTGLLWLFGGTSDSAFMGDLWTFDYAKARAAYFSSFGHFLTLFCHQKQGACWLICAENSGHLM